jgi:hypothetical protein
MHHSGIAKSSSFFYETEIQDYEEKPLIDVLTEIIKAKPLKRDFAF